MASITAKVELTKDEYSSDAIELTTTRRFATNDVGYREFMDWSAELWTRLTAPLEATAEEPDENG